MKTIAYITDSHLGESGPAEHGADALQNFKSVLSELSGRTVDELVIGGDIGAFEHYPLFFESLTDYKVKYATPGNHDTSAHVRMFFPDGLKPESSGFYSARQDDFLHYLFLDSSTDKISPEQIEWLKSELNQSDKPLIVFIHHPILEVDTPVDKKYPLQNREEIKSLLFAHQKQVTIFCGHYHTEDISSERNITQYLTPAVSYQIKKGSVEVEGDATYFGYRLIYIDQSAIETETIILYPDNF